jgi:hypothetical protein
VINLDQTGLHLVPAGSRTYETKGSKQVPIAGMDDKRQITAVVASSLDGQLLPLQLIFQGKTDASLPQHTDASTLAGFHLKMSQVKPKILQWALESWSSLREEKLLILKGWHKCVVSLYDVHDKEQQRKATKQAIEREIDASDAVPLPSHDCDQAPPQEDREGEAEEDAYCDEESDDEDKTEKQVMKKRVYGERKSSRDRKPAQHFGYQLSSAQLKFS